MIIACCSWNLKPSSWLTNEVYKPTSRQNLWLDVYFIMTTIYFFTFSYIYKVGSVGVGGFLRPIFIYGKQLNTSLQICLSKDPTMAPKLNLGSIFYSTFVFSTEWGPKDWDYCFFLDCLEIYLRNDKNHDWKVGKRDRCLLAVHKTFFMI